MLRTPIALRGISILRQHFAREVAGMFKLKPFHNFDEQQLDLPDCMFKMANIQGNSSKSSSNTSEETNPSVAALEQRQETILSDLRSLESQVASLTSKIRPDDVVSKSAPSSSAVRSTTTKAGTTTTTCLHDVVIYANPNNPPYSLLVLYDQLRCHYRCMTRVHIHSSVTAVPEKLKGYFNQNGAQEVTRTDAQLSLTLIWKSVSWGPEMRIQANTQTPIQGEVNILRYLSRLMTPAYDATDDLVSVATIDNYLDLAGGAISNGNTKEKAAAVRTLNSALGKRAWLVGDTITIADVAVWSALQQAGLAGSAPSNVQKWLKACAARKEFRTALSAVA